MPSLTRRLALLFALVGSLGPLGLGLHLSGSIERHFEQLDRDSLHAVLEDQPHGMEMSDAGQPLIWRGPDRTPREAAGRLIPFPPPAATALGQLAPGHEALLTWDDAGHAFRAIVIRGQTPGHDVVAALDIMHHAEFMAHYRATLWLAVAAAILLSALLGLFLARQGLRSLHVFTEHAREVDSERLGQRLQAAGLPVELRELAEAFNDMLSRLDDAFNRLSAYSEDIAHELRTPVNNLLTQTQVTLAQPRSGEQYRDTLASNAEELERLRRIVEDMLFLAKADNGLCLPHTERFDLGLAVQELCEYYDALAEEAGQQLEAQGRADVVGDRLMLRRAISNLLGNAIRHTAAGGRIVITLESTAEACRVSVHNPGPPLPDSLRTRVFERFVRGDPARVHSAGAGLGLAIVRSIVQAHGGTVFAHAEHGINTFGFSLPRSGPQAAEHPR